MLRTMDKANRSTVLLECAVSWFVLCSKLCSDQVNKGSGHHGTGLRPAGFRPEMVILGVIRDGLIMPWSV
jgi:hypothetical protein